MKNTFTYFVGSLFALFATVCPIAASAQQSAKDIETLSSATIGTSLLTTF